jgi:hypothetical protein
VPSTLWGAVMAAAAAAAAAAVVLGEREEEERSRDRDRDRERAAGGSSSAFVATLRQVKDYTISLLVSDSGPKRSLSSNGGEGKLL